MENDLNFRNKLMIFHLTQLISLDKREEFDRFYQSVESYLKDIIDNSRNLELLTQVKEIISYKTKTIGMNI